MQVEKKVKHKLSLYIKLEKASLYYKINLTFRAPQQGNSLRKETKTFSRVRSIFGPGAIGMGAINVN